MDELLKGVAVKMVSLLIVLCGVVVASTPLWSFVDRFAVSVDEGDGRAIVTAHRPMQDFVVEAHCYPQCALCVLADFTGLVVPPRDVLPRATACVWAYYDAEEKKPLRLPAEGSLLLAPVPCRAVFFSSASGTNGLPRQTLDDIKFQVILARRGGAVMTGVGLLYLAASVLWEWRVRRRRRELNGPRLPGVLLEIAQSWRKKLYPDVTGNEAQNIDQGAVDNFKKSLAAALTTPKTQADVREHMKSCVQRAYLAVFPVPPTPSGCLSFSRRKP